ncbi:Glyoxalase-like domain-containing protein [Gracilibacillus ureilyticus]|uniref:Glyoxalase-like domain-containing protein n=1 Tax=Gracilibacillus ureilyticus TaxID=531814 RepID=A0A1H9Q325_9BACI|nr:VOC family protein [Gracilibacillus ureilyticus]SER54818.1 Glyoxalase-like domain-containing protein [Gracilibacillus ureilyticus]
MFSIGSIFIPVTNLESSTEWFERNLDLKKISDWEDGAGFCLPSGSAQLSLVKVASAQATEFEIIRNNRNSYYNFFVNDIEAAHDKLISNGVKTSEIQDYDDMKFFDFFDLDNNPFSVVYEDINSPFHPDNIRKMQEKR